ncbi:tyrosine-type recombinase/integrase [Asticcacaulis sp.]|uniref:tyrosine-type recombinase/integrase n=1 Tax=Asticcacaulis sp. TaxID=1872648 RepID=UPI003F7BD8DA
MAKLTKTYDFVKAYTDRHGKMRYYYRRGGAKAIAIKGEFGSFEFDQAYNDAVRQWEDREPLGAGRIVPGSITDLIVQFYNSAEFKRLTATTQKNYRRIFEDFRTKFGAQTVRGLQREHIIRIKDRMADKPGAALTYLKRLNTLLNFAVDRRFRTDNPMLRFKFPKAGDGFAPWTDEEIDQYLAYWGPGTRERLALYLLLFTGQRRSDIVKMGHQHVRADEISVVQQKTGTRLWIPMHPILIEEIALWPKDQMMFLVNKRTGKPLSQEGFSNWIRDSAREAGITELRSPHGLRKAACRRLIEAGCDGETARAISGHASDKALQIYIKDVNQRKMARRAINSLPRDRV